MNCVKGCQNNRNLTLFTARFKLVKTNQCGIGAGLSQLDPDHVPIVRRQAGGQGAVVNLGTPALLRRDIGLIA